MEPVEEFGLQKSGDFTENTRASSDGFLACFLSAKMSLLSL